MPCTFTPQGGDSRPIESPINVPASARPSSLLQAGSPRRSIQPRLYAAAGHSQFAQARQNVATGGTAVDSELLLQTHHVHVADIEKVRGPQIGRQVLFLHLEPHYIGIFVSFRNVIDRHRQAAALRVCTLTAASRSVVNVAMPHLRAR
jgi:hypothetical protein